MSARLPSVELSLAIAVVLAVGALLLAGAAPAGASTVDVENTTENTTSTVEDTVNDSTDTLTSTTEDTTSMVDDTTGDTGSAVKDSTNSTASTTEDTVTEPVTSTLNTTTGTLGHSTPLDATSLALDDGSLVSSLEGTADGIVYSSSTTSTAEATPKVAEEGPTTRATGSDHAGSDGHLHPDRPPGSAGTSGPLSSIPAGAIALGGIAFSGVVLREMGPLWRQPWRPGSRAIASGRMRWRDWFRRLAGLAGYQRYDDSDPFRHDARSDLYEAIEATDWAYLTALSRETDIPLSTARYHLRILEHEDLVSSVKHRGKRRYIATGDQHSAIHAALEEDGPAAVIEALEEDGPASVSEIAETVDRAVSTVTHHLQRLEEDGIVVRERGEGAVLNRLATEARRALNSPAERRETGAVADD